MTTCLAPRARTPHLQWWQWKYVQAALAEASEPWDKSMSVYLFQRSTKHDSASLHLFSLVPDDSYFHIRWSVKEQNNSWGRQARRRTSQMQENSRGKGWTNVISPSIFHSHTILTMNISALATTDPFPFHTLSTFESPTKTSPYIRNI